MYAGYDLARVKMKPGAGPGEYRLLFPGTRFNPRTMTLKKPDCLASWDIEVGEEPIRTQFTWRLRPGCSLAMEKRPGEVLVRLNRSGKRGPEPARGSPEEYRLGPGDVLALDLPGHPEFNLEAPVEKDGRVTFPLVGAVSAAGKTVGEVENEVREKLKSYFLHPEPHLRITSYRSFQVAVEGAVQRPGRYTLHAPATVLDAVEAAGGMTSRSVHKVIVHRIPTAEEPEQLTLGLEEARNTTLRDGDRIVVPTGEFVYLSLGEARPWPLRWSSDMRLRDALEEAGVLEAGFPRRVRLIRRVGERTKTLQYEITTEQDEDLEVPLQPEDILQILPPPEREEQSRKPAGRA